MSTRNADITQCDWAQHLCTYWERLIYSSHDSRTNNTLITSIYLCCVDTWKQLWTSTLVVMAVPACTRVVGSLYMSYLNSSSDPRASQDGRTAQSCWLSKVTTMQWIGIALFFGVHLNTWGTTYIGAIPYTWVEWTTSVVATLSIRINYNYTR